MTEESEKRETVADIVAEMRKESKKVRNVTRPDGYGGYEVITLEGHPYLKNLADRIEAARKRKDSAWRRAVLDFCNAFTTVYEPPFSDCPMILAGAFMMLCERLGIEQVKIGGNDGK